MLVIETRAQWSIRLVQQQADGASGVGHSTMTNDKCQKRIELLPVEPRLSMSTIVGRLLEHKRLLNHC